MSRGREFIRRSRPSFTPTARLDIPATLAHVDRLIDAGLHGLIMLGTVGENCSLEYAEKLEILRATVDHVGGRVPVLSGVAEYTTQLACRFASDAEKIGVDGLMVLPALVYKSDPRETIAHFRTVARSTSVDLMVYNNPVSYQVDVTPEMFAELADEPKLVAIKESSENVRRITDLKNVCGDRYVLFCGVDDLVLESVLLGVTGWISGWSMHSRSRVPVSGSSPRPDAGKKRGRSTAGTRRSCISTPTSSSCSTSSWRSRNAASAQRSSAPRACRSSGEEREEILAIIRKGIAARPDPSGKSPRARSIDG